MIKNKNTIHSSVSRMFKKYMLIILGSKNGPQASIKPE
jgi:hypothetical protein